VRINATSAAPVAIAFANSAIATLPTGEPLTHDAGPHDGREEKRRADELRDDSPH
jgi:hypothetical protein